MNKETEREKKAKKNLTQRQIRFVQDFMKSNNVTQAAIHAGYSKKTASVQGSRLLTNVKVAEYVDSINERLKLATKNSDLNQQQLFNSLLDKALMDLGW